ncbi:MAG: ECF transporter S component [Eubacteriales bacterium]|nr:ECF transporter S component [Eubacteriales bacterium]MDD3074417.1 ECF transporter S component [Eubacteriales bacterium]MDD4769698.1 ECF transporter S component [Eubacteriales bacterium]
MNTNTKKIVTLAMLSAIAYVVMAVGRIPIIPTVEFLKYDPKDIIITIGGFVFGPLSAFLMSVVVSLVEMVTVSESGIIGLIMNVISTCAFACTAAFIYKHKRTLSGAVIGLIAGGLAMTGIMLLWNYIITPIYMGVPRETVANMLMPIFLPFNLLKSGLNAALTMLLYKPLITVFRKSNLIPEPEANGKKQIFNLGVLLVSLFVLGTCILIILLSR